MSKLYNLRKYGKPPYATVVVHGGPGAAGSMAPVAKKLSSVSGILEPLFKSKTVNGQLEELYNIINDFAEIPVILAGHSWGAWLIYIFAAYYPEMVNKIILIGSGPFKEEYARSITRVRLNRLIEEEKVKLRDLQNALNSADSEDNADNENRDDTFTKLGALISLADSFNPLPSGKENEMTVSYDIYQSVWEEACQLRRSGKLIGLGENIRCPVVAIHGDYDPHPHKGVEKPLSEVIGDFRMILLKNCGHEPWLEKLARNKFYEILKSELKK
jgi:pimeloyl-ACP methyl ester carboxylesterase